MDFQQKNSLIYLSPQFRIVLHSMLLGAYFNAHVTPCGIDFVCEMRSDLDRCCRFLCTYVLYVELLLSRSFRYTSEQFIDLQYFTVCRSWIIYRSFIIDHSSCVIDRMLSNSRLYQNLSITAYAQYIYKRSYIMNLRSLEFSAQRQYVIWS